MAFPLYVYRKEDIMEIKRPQIDIIRDISQQSLFMIKDIQDIQKKFNDLKNATSQDQYMRDVEMIEKDLSDLYSRGNVVYKDILELINKN